MEDLCQADFSALTSEDRLDDSAKPPFSSVSTTAKRHVCSAPQCLQEFESNKQLNEHKVTVHKFVKCTVGRCSRMFTKESRLAKHVEHYHSCPTQTLSGPTDTAVGKSQRAEAGDMQLVEELEEETMQYLGGVRGIACKKGKTSTKRMQKLMGFMVKDLGEEVPTGPGMTLSFLLHALDVALALPSVRKSEQSPPPTECLKVLADDVSLPLAEVKIPTDSPKRRKRIRSATEVSFPASITSEEVLNMVPAGKRRGPKPSEHMCGKCGKVFPYKKELSAHKYAEHPSKRRQSALFEVQTLSLVAPEVPTQGGSYHCIDSGCAQTYKTEDELLSHVRVSHDM